MEKAVKLATLVNQFGFVLDENQDLNPGQYNDPASDGIWYDSEDGILHNDLNEDDRYNEILAAL